MGVGMWAWAMCVREAGAFLYVVRAGESLQVVPGRLISANATGGTGFLSSTSRRVSPSSSGRGVS